MIAPWSAADRAALAALLASALLCGAAGWRLWTTEPLPGPAAARPVGEMPAPTPVDGGADRAVLAAVERDPFRPDRRRAPGRYRLPGEPDPEAAPPAPSRAPAPLRLRGTVVLGGGGLAAVARPTGEGRVLRVGDSFAGYRLVSVDAGTATLRGADSTLVLRMDGAEVQP